MAMSFIKFPTAQAMKQRNRKIFYDDPIPPTLTLKGGSEDMIQAGF